MTLYVFPRIFRKGWQDDREPKKFFHPIFIFFLNLCICTMQKKIEVFSNFVVIQVNLHENPKISAFFDEIQNVLHFSCA